MNLTPTLPSATGVDRVLESVRADILTGRLQPGDPINEDSIAARLGVSHTPVREAVMDLIGQGFVERSPSRHRHVAHCSPRRAVEIVQLQGLLHQFGLQRAAVTATDLEIDQLAQLFDVCSRALLTGVGTDIDSTTADLVAGLCSAARHSALSIALPRASQRGFALVLLPDEAWQLWHEWGATMAGFAAQLRNREVTRTADDYLAAELSLADRMASMWPDRAAWPPPDHRGHLGQTRAEAVAERIRTEILDGHLAPGDAIREMEVASRLGVSTTPVREALRLLVADDLVELESNRRRRVVRRSDAQIADLLALVHHLVSWQLDAAEPSLSAPQLAEVARLAARLADRLAGEDTVGFAGEVLQLFEWVAHAAGNREVWAVVRNGLSVVLPRWAAAGVPLDAFARSYGAFAALESADRRGGVRDLVDELFSLAQASLLEPESA